MIRHSVLLGSLGLNAAGILIGRNIAIGDAGAAAVGTILGQ
jgi:hypothetical protein